MKRWLVLILAGWAFASLDGSAARDSETPETLIRKSRLVLAQLEGDVTLPGLKEPVEVLRDRWGVPHIYARNTEDLFFAQGFVAAQDRLFQIDLWRRLTTGELSEVLGKQGLEGDRFARLMKYRGDPEAEWTSYSPDTRLIATSFTRGINAHIDQIGTRWPIEFQILGFAPKKWQPEDCLGRMSGVIMTSNFRNEISRAELVAAVGVERARRVAPTDPIRSFGLAPGLDPAGIDRTILAGYTTATRPFYFEVNGGGSNNWAVDGRLSASGKPLLASDPHRPINLPSLRYLVHLNAPGWNVIGSGEPALPGVAVGHNEHVAWGITIVGTDQSDFYVEETDPVDPTRYKVGNRWEPMKVVREKVRLKGQEKPYEHELFFTRHGAVVHQDLKHHRAYVLKWVGSEPGTAAYLGSLALDRVRNWREFIDALNCWKVPALNVTYADVDGNIGWVAAGLTPIRKGWDGLLPVPGAGGEYEWQGFLAVKDLPQSFNPPNHFIATANHNILPDGYHQAISYEWAPSYRYHRIKQRLEARKKFDLEDFKNIQHDNTTLPGLTLARMVKTVDMRDPKLQPYVDLLAHWDGVLSVDARAGPLYAVWLHELLDAFYKPHVPAHVLDFVRSRGGIATMLAALEKPDKFWFSDDPGAGRDRLLRQTFASAVPKVKSLLPGDSNHWTWGKLHTVTFRHPLSTMGPAYAKAFNLGPVARPGDGVTPNAASHNGKYQQIAGASYRHVLDLADWDRGWATSTPGQSGQPGSPHYGDLLPLWEKGEYFPLMYSRNKVEQVTQHRLRLRPLK